MEVDGIGETGLFIVRRGGVSMKKVYSIIGMILSIVLMALPKGVPMNFAPSPTETVTSYYSYFSPMPFGYGNWFPIITAILSICVVVLLLIGLKRNCISVIKICLGITIIATLLSWAIFNAFSFISLAVIALHIYVLIIEILPKDIAK